MIFLGKKLKLQVSYKSHNGSIRFGQIYCLQDELQRFKDMQAQLAETELES